MKNKRCVYFFAILMVLAARVGFAQELVIEDPVEKNLVIEVQPEDSFLEVMDFITHHFRSNEIQEGAESVESQQSFTIDVQISSSGMHEIVAKKANNKRDYYVLGAQDIADITYIVTSMASKEFWELNPHKMNKAGSRVEHVHPLRFLICIFSDPNMSVCMRNIKGKTLVWKEFLKGITGSLAKEHKAKNVLPYVDDFAIQVKADPNKIRPFLNAEDFTGFVSCLIDSSVKPDGSDRQNQ